MATSTTDPLNLGMSGLASGIDTSTIVQQLMAINAQPQNALKLQQSAMQARLTALQGLQTELQNLKGAADDLASPGLFAPVQSVDSSDPTKVSGTRISGAGVGGTELNVIRLASSQQRTYAYTPSSTDTTLDFGSGQSIAITAGSSVDDVVTAINSATGLPVYAASITDPNDPTGTNKLLVLSSKTPGSNGDFSLAADTTTGLVENTSMAKAHAATAWQHTFDYTADPANATTITIGSTNVSIGAGSTVDDVVSAINGASAGVTASKDSNGRLLLTSNNSGSGGNFSASGSTIAEYGSGVAGQDSTLSNLNAAYTVDGGPTRYATSNVVDGAIPGLELTFKATGSVTVTVGAPGPDHAAIKAQVHAFVDLYNANMADISAKLAEQPVLNPTSSTDAAKGLFFADSTLQSIQDNLRTALMSPIGNDPTLSLLSQIGISTGDTTGGSTLNQDAVSGKLVVDDDKLDAMLDTNPDGVKVLLGATLGKSGFSQAFDAVLDPEVQAGGDFDMLIQQTNSQISDLTGQISDWDTRLSDMQDRLKAQFSAMELALSQNQSQGQWLAGQIASLH
jgi:flagellar hook-associated protein 2